MTPLRQTMIDAMQQRGFAVRTQQTYLAAVKDLARYFHRSPDQLTPDEIHAYFRYLALERHLSGASCRLYLNAIHFLYLQVLHWSEFPVDIVVPKKNKRRTRKNKDIHNLKRSVDFNDRAISFLRVP